MRPEQPAVSSKQGAAGAAGRVVRRQMSVGRSPTQQQQLGRDGEAPLWHDVRAGPRRHGQRARPWLRIRSTTGQLLVNTMAADAPAVHHNSCTAATCTCTCACGGAAALLRARRLHDALACTATAVVCTVGEGWNDVHA